MPYDDVECIYCWRAACQVSVKIDTGGISNPLQHKAGRTNLFANPSSPSLAILTSEIYAVVPSRENAIAPGLANPSATTLVDPSRLSCRYTRLGLDRRCAAAAPPFKAPLIWIPEPSSSSASVVNHRLSSAGDLATRCGELNGRPPYRDTTCGGFFERGM